MTASLASFVIVSLAVLFTWTAGADETCAERARAFAECGEPWPAEMVSPNGNWPPPVEARPAELVRMVEMLNAGAQATTRCAAAGRAAEAACDNEEDLVKAAGERYLKHAGYVIGWRKTLVGRAQRLANDQGRAVTCLATNTPYGPAEMCRILDRARTHAREVSHEGVAELPLTVGISGLCSFVVDAYSRLVTADHCGNTLRNSGWVITPTGDQRTTPTLAGQLPHSPADIASGAPFEDLSVWTSHEAKPGRKFYTLVRDPARAQGCRAKDDYYLSCAPSVFKTLTGRQAHALGFPSVRYRSRDHAESVMLSDGDLIYDDASKRYLIHAAVSRGFSGGPTYLDAGEVVGGVKLDRPLYLGPISGFAPQIPPRTAFETDVLAIVAVYDETRMRSVLPSYLHGPSASR